jgi:hypothetical protein
MIYVLEGNSYYLWKAPLHLVYLVIRIIHFLFRNERSNGNFALITFSGLQLMQPSSGSLNRSCKGIAGRRFKPSHVAAFRRFSACRMIRIVRADIIPFQIYLGGFYAGVG